MTTPNIPEIIHIDDFILQPIPATMEYAQFLFDTCDTDKDGFKFWMLGEPFVDVNEVCVMQQNHQQRKERLTYLMYGIFNKDELLGEIGFTFLDIKNKTAKIGYWLKKSARGHGIINKLIQTIENLGFETLELRKIGISCDPDNTASKIIAEKNGYVLEGILRENRLWPDGSIHDSAMYGKLKSEWNNK